MILIWQGYASTFILVIRSSANDQTRAPLDWRLSLVAARRILTVVPRVLLAVIDHDPAVVERALKAA